MLVTHTFGRQRQVDLWEFEGSLGYRASSRTARTVVQRTAVSIKTLWCVGNADMTQ